MRKKKQALKEGMKLYRYDINESKDCAYLLICEVDEWCGKDRHYARLDWGDLKSSNVDGAKVNASQIGTYYDLTIEEALASFLERQSEKLDSLAKESSKINAIVEQVKNGVYLNSDKSNEEVKDEN